MKTLVTIALTLALFSVAAYGQPVPAPPPPEIATPPGATLITEINLSENDVLPMFRQAVEGLAQAAQGMKGEIGDALKTLDIKTLVDAFQGLKAVRAMQLKLAPQTTAEQVLGFYQDQLKPSEGWSRMLFDISMADKGAGAVYTRGGQDFVLVGVAASKGRAFVGRTVGTVDIPKLASWAGRAALLFASRRSVPEPKPAQPVTVTPKAPVKKTTPPKTK